MYKKQQSRRVPRRQKARTTTATPALILEQLSDANMRGLIVVASQHFSALDSPSSLKQLSDEDTTSGQIFAGSTSAGRPGCYGVAGYGFAHARWRDFTNDPDDNHICDASFAQIGVSKDRVAQIKKRISSLLVGWEQNRRPSNPAGPGRPRACIQCRQLKNKCSVSRPCTSCVASGCGDACEDANPLPKRKKRNSLLPCKRPRNLNELCPDICQDLPAHLENAVQAIEILETWSTGSQASHRDVLMQALLTRPSLPGSTSSATSCSSTSPPSSTPGSLYA